MKLMRTSYLLVLIVLLLRPHISDGVYTDYYYSNYDAEMRALMFIPGATVPKLHIPYTVAVLNITYCSVANRIMADIEPIYQKMMTERNIHLRIICNYTAPQNIVQAIQLYHLLQGIANTMDGVDALIGEYNPLVSTIASSLNLTFVIVNSESGSLNSRLQDISSIYTQSPPGSPLGSYADLNNNTLVAETFWYRSFLYSSILDQTALGNKIFGSLLQNFLQIGIICDDSVLLSQFVVVDKGPYVTSLVTMQLDTLYPPTPAALNNVTSSSMDSWTSNFANVTALLISTNSTYSMMILPQILQSLLNVGFFTSSTVTLFTNFYIGQNNILQYSDLQTNIFGTLSTVTLQSYNRPIPSFNITLPTPPGFLPTTPLLIDPVSIALATGMYFFSMNLLRTVYKQSYLEYVIQSQNWPPMVTQLYYFKYSISYGLATVQYNRCNYVSTVLQVAQPSNCSAAEFAQEPFVFLGFWQGTNLMIGTNTAYLPVARSSSTSQSTTITSTIGNSLAYKTLRVGLVIDNPWVIFCQECAQTYEGYAIDILGNLSLILKFNYTLYSQLNYATLMSNLANGKLDVGIGGIMWTNDTMTYYGSNVKLMMPILESGVNLLIRNDTTVKWWSWLSPYSNLLWYMLLVLATILTFVFMILDTIDPNRLGKRLFDFFASYWYVFGAFTQSAVEIMPVTLSTKLLSMIMWFTVIIYVSAFTAAYTSSLILENNVPFASTLPAALSTYRSSYDPYYFIANSTAAQYLSSSSYSDLYTRAMNNPDSYIIRNAFDAAGHLLDQFTFGGFIGDARVNQWMSNAVDCWLITVGDIDAVYSTYYSIIAVQPNSTFFDTFRKELINLERLRVLDKMKEFYFDSTCSSDLPPSSLSLDHLAGLYIALAVGCAISLVATITIVFLKKLQLRAERDNVQRQRPFDFGKLYVAKVLIVRENSGVLLKVYRSERDERRDASGKKTEFPPTQYSMLIKDLNLGNAKEKKPSEMGIQDGSRILVKYLGFNPDTDHDRFVYYKHLDSASAD